MKAYIRETLDLNGILRAGGLVVSSLIFPALVIAQEVEELSVPTSKQKVYDSAVNFANWIDRYFGQQEELESARYDFLRLVNTIGWREREGVEYKPRVKAKVHLPKISRKVSLLFSDDSLDDTAEYRDDQNDELFEDDDESSSAAINYESEEYERSKFDTRIGFDSSLDSFVLLKHTYRVYEDTKNYFRNYNYIFWRDKEGQGTNIKLEYDRILGEDTLFRWKYSILHAEKSEGNEWRSMISFVNHLADDHWLSYDFSINGATEHNYDVEAYRFAMRYRTQLSKDWFFLEIEPELLWRRTTESLEREFVPGIIFRFEFQFED